MDERTVLRRAKEVLLERGWHRGEFCADPMGETGPVCLVGALGVAVHGCAYTHTGTRPAARVIRDALGAAALVALPIWNDCRATSIDDVIALLDRAIASLPVSPQEEVVEVVHA